MSDEVTPTESETYWKFVFDLIKQRISRETPSTLWHYTGGGSLIEIIKSGTLHMTQIACLNDTTEFRYSIEKLRNAFERRRSRTTRCDEIELLDYILENLSTQTDAIGWFVACFSQRRDDLSQWRAYGGGENGYSIGFDALALARSLGPDHYLAPVIYESDVHAQIADEVADATVTFFSRGLGGSSRTPARWRQSFLTVWSEAIGYIAPVIKDPAFEQEEEWRILHPFREADITQTIYRQKRTLMSRHIPIKFLARGCPPDKKLLPITEVMVGPSRHKSVSRVSVGDLMRTQGYGPALNVSASNVPFQET